jgi:SPP1 family predicted phage head-tail adaptor
MANTVHINPGMLNRKIQIQKNIDSPDGSGGLTRQWVTVFTCWAQVSDLGGSEPYEHMQNYPHQNYHITIRYRLGISANMRVLYRGKILNIRSIQDENEEHALISMTCEELGARGTAK